MNLRDCFPSAAIFGFALLASLAAAETDRFGGTLAIQREATGHFRVEQMQGRWMFITPEGHGYTAAHHKLSKVR
jgi:hypothetical protein